MFHLVDLANEYQKDTIRRAEQRRLIEEAVGSTSAKSASESTPRTLGHTLFGFGLRFVARLGK